MASPPSSREEPRSPLPAPYEDPWRRLATDLAAVVASAGLKVREIWRLNGEGSLGTPAFWPRDLAPLFWPLLLALGLALMVGLGLRLTGWWGGLAADPGAKRTATVAPQASGQGPDSGLPGIPSANPDPDVTGLAGGPSAAPRPADPGGGSPDLPSFWPWRKGPGGEQADRAAGGPAMVEPGAGSAADPTAGAPSTTVRDDSSPLDAGDGPTAGRAADSMAGSAAENAASSVISPLVELVGVDPPPWVLALEQRPAEGLLRLQLAGAYEALPFAERRTLAERWLARCRELGYERLELVDPAGRTLGRPARVGSGMILLDALSTPP